MKKNSLSLCVNRPYALRLSCRSGVLFGKSGHVRNIICHMLFSPEKLNVSVVTVEKHAGLLTAAEEKAVKDAQEENKMLLSIPRRYVCYYPQKSKVLLLRRLEVIN